MCSLYTKLDHGCISTIGKSLVYLEFRHPLGVLDCIPVDEGGPVKTYILRKRPCPIWDPRKPG